MASLQEPGMVEVWAVRVDGTRKKIINHHVTNLAPGGGAPDAGGAAVVTPNLRLFIPAGGPVLRPNDHIEVVFIAEGADGIDVSDGVWLIPVTEYDSKSRLVGMKTLSSVQFADPAPADYTTVANIPTIVGAYKVTEAGLRIGGGPIYLDFQDDT